MRVRAHEKPPRSTYPIIDGGRARARAPRSWKAIVYRSAIVLGIAIVIGAIILAIALMPADAFFSGQCGETMQCR